MRAASLGTLRPLALALAVTAAACGSSSTGTGSGGTSGGGHVGTGGTSATGTGGSSATGTGGSSATGSGGTSSGAGGTSTGTGGSTAGTTGTGTAGTTGAGGGTSTCPADATFCSGFESPGLPTGATYLFNGSPGDWSRDFAIDTTQHHAGNSSLLVKNSTANGSSNSALRLLGVPVPTGPFWARFWVQSDIQMGGTNPHNAFAGPSNFDTGNTNGIIDAFCEDRGIAFNTTDPDITWPTGYGQLQSGTINPYTIPAMTWKCVELSYDLAGRHQQLYIGGTLVIDAANYPPASSYAGTTFAAFTFGLDAFNGPPRQMWYDDVAVTPTRIPNGCL